MRTDKIIIFFNVFPKSKKANLNNVELEAAQKTAAQFLRMTKEEILTVRDNGVMREIDPGEDDEVKQGDEGAEDTKLEYNERE